jgi:Zn-finger nucleic acid-binding protein
VRPCQFLDTQLLDVIQWSEPEAGTLAYRYPMLDMEIQTGAKLVVRESEMAVFVSDGKIADVLGPGAYALNAANLPLLAGMKGWDRSFAPGFKADIYFFSAGEVMGQRWGTTTPVMPGDTESGAVPARGYGSYSYRIADVRTFFAQVSGTRESYFVYDLDDRLRKTIVARMTDAWAANGISHPDATANAAELSDRLAEQIKPAFAALGLDLTQFTVQSVTGGVEEAEGAPGCTCCGASLRADHGVLKCDYCHAVVVADAGEAADVSAEFEGQACPACSIPLLSATVGGASLLYCTRCDGMLVAMEEFEALVAAARALPGGAVPVAAADLRDTYDCPECKRGMGVSFYGGDVAIDSCEDCGWNWLDHGELARIAHGPVCEVGASGAYFNPARAGASELNLGV